jgi:hypothetical protein
MMQAQCLLVTGMERKSILSVFLMLASALTSRAAPTTPTTAEIVERMMAHNQQQDRVLLGYRTQRKFFATNVRFKLDSTMVVQTVFRKPDSMESSVVSQAGSELIKSRVFDEILRAEGETHKKEDKQQVDITPRNYDFALAGQDICDGRSCYRVRITPKRKDKYSLKGDVWVDAEDYAIVRVHGAPVKKPSFFTLKTEIDKRYRKIDGIWLTDRLDSWSDILIGGHSTLSIEYQYETVQTQP